MMNIDVDLTGRMLVLIVMANFGIGFIVRHRGARVCWSRLVVLESAIWTLEITMAIWYAAWLQCRIESIVELVVCSGALSSMFALLIVIVASMSMQEPSFFSRFCKDMIDWQEKATAVTKPS